MKCFEHENIDAIATCETCNKGLCKDSIKSLFLKSYCKTHRNLMIYYGLAIVVLAIAVYVIFNYIIDPIY